MMMQAGLTIPTAVNARRDDEGSPAPGRASERMACMEVWGGNGMTDTAVSTTGLDVWLYCRPHGEAQGGGDIYALSSCSSGRITRLALADVRGHGESVLALAGSLRQLMRRHINHISQSKLLRALNHEFAELGDPSTYATGLVATFFVPTRTLSLTNAGHPPPLQLDRRAGAWRTLEQDTPSAKMVDIPLGMFQAATYRQLSLRMKTDDLLLCYTDGLEECVDEKGNLLGPEGVASILADTNADEPGTIIPDVVRRVTAMAPDNLTQDDVTIMLVRPNGASVSWRDNLLAPFRYLADAIGLGKTRDTVSPSKSVPSITMRSSTVNYLLYQVGWLALVLGAARDAAGIGLSIGLALVGVHLLLVHRVAPEVRLLALAGTVGAVTDSVLVSAGLLSFSSGVLLDGLAPPWIVVMWIQFATTLRYALRWLRGRPGVAAAFGAIGGPLAYLVGDGLGAVSLAGPATLLALAAAWALVLPWLTTVAASAPTAGYRFDVIRDDVPVADV